MDFYTKISSKKLSKSLDGGACPKGQIIRQGYVTSSGKRVSRGCITAQSSTGRKSSKDIQKYVQAREKIQKEARKKFSKEVPKSCPNGYILREGYKRDSYKSHSKKGDSIKVKSSWTKPECIKSQTGKSEKGEKLIVIIEKDVLGKYGYDKVKSLSPKERRSALRKAISEIKPLSVYRRLVALSTLNKGKDKGLAKILKEDSEWIKTQSQYIVSKSGSKTSKSNKSKASKISTKSKTSKKSKQRGGTIPELNNTENKYYDVETLLKKYSKKSNSKLASSKKSDSKLSLSKKNKLFYYKDN